jgi:hypothetical protein
MCCDAPTLRGLLFAGPRSCPATTVAFQPVSWCLALAGAAGAWGTGTTAEVRACGGAMASPQGDLAGSGCVSGRAIIVHPNSQHTLPARRACPLPARWQNLPVDVLHRVAARLASARDLCSFERICRSSRCGADGAPLPLWGRARVPVASPALPPLQLVAEPESSSAAGRAPTAL